MFPYGNGFNTINHKEVSYMRTKFSHFIIDETQLKVGHNHFWIWIDIKSDDKTILGNHIYHQKEICLLQKERFLNSLISQYGKHTVSTDGVVRGILFNLVNF